MSTLYTRSMLTAAVLACAFAGAGVRPALAQHRMAVTAVGCLQGEREYRRGHESTKFAGTGVGLNDEYVLIDAVIGGSSMNVAPISEQESLNCTASRGSRQAFELKGKAESGLASYLGRRVVIRGMLLHAKHDAVATDGKTFTPAPTSGGTDILNHDLDLREINVESVSLMPIKAAAKNEPTIIGAPEPQPETAPAVEPAPAPAEPAAQAPAPAPTLPKTASPLLAIALVGLLSLLGAGALRLFNRQPF